MISPVMPQIARSSTFQPGAALLAALFVCLCACSDPVHYSTLPSGSKVLAFGDSVTHGTGAERGEDYPAHLARLSGWEIINAGIPGDMARDARKRLPALLREHQPDLVIIELGGNDFLRKRSAALVGADLRDMVLQVKQADAIPVLVAVPRLSLLRASTGMLEDDRLYATLAEEEQILLIDDIFSQVLSDSDLRADRIHPNAQGYRELATGIAAQLRSAGLL
jgi:acyl-CoA hydrolase